MRTTTGGQNAGANGTSRSANTVTGATSAAKFVPQWARTETAVYQTPREKKPSSASTRMTIRTIQRIPIE